MAKPNNQQFQQDPVLTGIAIAYKNPDNSLIADDVLPRIPAPDSDFKWQSYDDAEMFTVPDTRVGRRSAPNQVEIEGVEKTSSTEEYGIDIPLDNKTIKQAEKKGWKPKNRATARATNIIMLDREVRVAKLVQDPNQYHEDNKAVLTVAQQISNPDSDPLNLILEYLDACLMRPNQIAFGNAVWRLFRQHAKVVKAIHGNSGDSGAVTRQQVADLFEVNKVLVGSSRVNIKKPGEAAVLARTWGNTISGQYIDREADTSGGVTFGFTAQEGTRIAGELPASMGLTGGVLIRSGEEVKELIVASRAGFLLENAIEGA
jgi:hypothetical protein